MLYKVPFLYSFFFILARSVATRDARRQLHQKDPSKYPSESVRKIYSLGRHSGKRDWDHCFAQSGKMCDRYAFSWKKVVRRSRTYSLFIANNTGYCYNLFYLPKGEKSSTYGCRAQRLLNLAEENFLKKLVATGFFANDAK